MLSFDEINTVVGDVKEIVEGLTKAWLPAIVDAKRATRRHEIYCIVLKTSADGAEAALKAADILYPKDGDRS